MCMAWCNLGTGPKLHLFFCLGDNIFHNVLGHAAGEISHILPYVFYLHLSADNSIMGSMENISSTQFIFSWQEKIYHGGNHEKGIFV